jgi:serine/threonine protein kinase
MAPEVVRRRQADRRLDVFSFGVTAYEICTLDLPWPRGPSGKAASPGIAKFSSAIVVSDLAASALDGAASIFLRHSVT